ncbi:lactadherin-like [Acanthaster planci]|uniref:Lactadherin-like n=1 Tax=Acanthaster planci TaxID=133434 RepID=A0A8B7XSC3_ACAPL|nr:lactadherin-like [Acanthaster planci]
MEDKTIPDRSISASSTWGSSYPARKARLNGAGMWAADSGDANAWIEVDLGESTEVNGVVTQGKDAWYVTNYKVAYQEQPSSERVHVAGESGNAKIFIGNSNGNTPVTNMFNERVDAVTVRIEPTGWQRGVALRLELLGCRR